MGGYVTRLGARRAATFFTCAIAISASLAFALALVLPVSASAAPVMSPFTPYPDGYQFANYPGTADWELYDDVFGGHVHLWSKADLTYFNNNFVDQYGHYICYGFSTTAGIFYRGVFGEAPSFYAPSATSTWDIPRVTRSGAANYLDEPIERHVSKYYYYQYSPQIRASRAGPRTAANAAGLVDLVEDELEAGWNDPWLLNYWGPWGGHSVNIVGLERTAEGAIFKIWDNNVPDDNIPPPAIRDFEWSPAGFTYGTRQIDRIMLRRISVHERDHIDKWWGDPSFASQYIWVSRPLLPDIFVLHTDVLGRRLGRTAGAAFDEIPGAEEVVPLTGGPDYPVPAQYYLPFADYTVDLMNPAAGDVYYQAFTGDTMFSVAAEGTGPSTAHVSSLLGQKGFAYSSDGEAENLRTSLTRSISAAEERSFDITMTVPAGGSFSMTPTVGVDAFSLTPAGTGAITCDVGLRQATPSIAITETIPGVPLLEGATLLVEPADWSRLTRQPIYVRTLMPDGRDLMLVYNATETSVRVDGFEVQPPAPEGPERFGGTVAIDGDTMLVGSPDIDASTGAVRVFTRTPSGWDYERSIEATDGVSGDQFGSAIAFEGDTVLIGAQGVDGGRGAAYVYEHDGGVWEYKQKLTPSGLADVWTGFGWRIAFDGDVAVVSAPGANAGTGAAYVFVREGGIWVRQQMLEMNGSQTGDSFGRAVAVDGTNILVGAPRADLGTGAAYVYTREGSEWVYDETLVSPYGLVGYEFGASTAIDKDVALVGESEEGVGYVHYFARVGSRWVYQQTFIASDGVDDEHFGYPISLEGDVALIGAASASEDKGAAYVFDRRGGVWAERDKLTATGLADGDYFADATALDRDTGVCGTPNADMGTGRAYVFDDMLGPYTPVGVDGRTRYETAIEASKEAFPHGAETVIIATGETFPDALGGAALAGALDAPILLTQSGSVPSAVMAEIERLGATDAIILGGPGAVSPAVASALGAELGSGHVTRIGGATRYETADLIARAVEAKVPGAYDGTAFVATGLDFPDALAGSPLAAAGPWPIFLTSPSGLSASTIDAMEDIGVRRTIVLGGSSVVPVAIQRTLEDGLGADNVTRVAGRDRYETAANTATHGVLEAGLRWNGVALAKGEDFPDALAGGPLQGRKGSAMLLSPSEALAPVTRAVLQTHADEIATVRFLGGPNALGAGVRAEVAQILQ